jgi:hypothetical protein
MGNDNLFNILESNFEINLSLGTVKNKFVTKRINEPRTWTDFLDRGPKQRNMDMRFECCGLDWFGSG